MLATGPGLLSVLMVSCNRQEERTARRWRCGEKGRHSRAHTRGARKGWAEQSRGAAWHSAGSSFLDFHELNTEVEGKKNCTYRIEHLRRWGSPGMKRWPAPVPASHPAGGRQAGAHLERLVPAILEALAADGSLRVAASCRQQQHRRGCINHRQTPPARLRTFCGAEPHGDAGVAKGHEAADDGAVLEVINVGHLHHQQLRAAAGGAHDGGRTQSGTEVVVAPDGKTLTPRQLQRACVSLPAVALTQ